MLLVGYLIMFTFDRTQQPVCTEGEKSNIDSALHRRCRRRRRRCVLLL